MIDKSGERSTQTQENEEDINLYPTEQERVLARRELVWSLSRRGLSSSDIIRVMRTKYQRLIVNLTEISVAQTIRKDIRIGRRVAGRLKEMGVSGVALAEYEAIGQLKELFYLCILNKEFSVARQLVHDLARLHGIEIEEAAPLIDARSFSFNQQQNNSVSIHGNGHEPSSIEEVERNILALQEEVSASLRSAKSAAGMVEHTESKKEPH